jgi:hypothetical protein
VEYTQFDRHPAYGRDEYQPGDERRAGGLRRQADRAERMRELVAFAVSLCGGLVVLYIFFVAIGTVDIGDATAATVGAIVLAVIWIIAFWRRMKTTTYVQRPDRERRGF